MKRRTAFTIVELLVAMALIVLIMAIMSEAFVSGLDSVGHLKATGDMQEHLRVAAAPMRRDILSRHFDTELKVSQLQKQPDGGFFRIVQNGQWYTTNANLYEGADADGIPSYRHPDNGAQAGCELHFTVRNVTGNAPRRDDYFTARVPQNSLAETSGPTAFRQPGNGQGLGEAIEVRYFLRPVAGETALGGLQLFSLHRRQRVIHSNVSSLNLAGSQRPIGEYALYGESACVPNTATNFLDFKTLADLAQPANRTLFNRSNAAVSTFPSGLSGDNTVIGDDLVMTDVLSFTVEVLVRDNPNNIPGVTPYNFVPISSFCPQVSAGVWEYDTASTQAPLVNPVGNTIVPGYYNLKAIKVTLRVWDYKKNLTRQITLIEEL